MKKSTVGGSALLEGLMMIGPKTAAIAIRKPDGEIAVELRPLPAKSRLSKLFILRGAVGFFKQMALSMQAMMYSASFTEEEESHRSSKFERLLERLFGSKADNVLIYFALTLSLLLSIGIFILLPNLVVGLLPFNKATLAGAILYNLAEAVLKVAILFGYMALASGAKDIKRMWQYHGAEHKTINCYENDNELTVINVMKHSTKNVRCSTSYLFLVVMVSIVLFSFVGWHSMWLNILIRLLLMPLVAGITFELFKCTAYSSSWFARAISAPGLLLQRFTTSEPDECQIEVAIAAFNHALAAEDAQNLS
ncbi:DUF1385 domain-containing protein [Acetanaerobacterium elongatum]|uniref:Uncharacterized conserved protein YqhQ n=1 Tax=Acetanaerobacterium elongatum TaxID=258515 RepID=A0A1H0GSU2_9FIRM|nr:DUF1385 domain-containing protein [Acetanaerobacterium elongatum]SDO09894.1 Uncharacterized conserved protein YqhQ [Acetanaerobacterium elongatum]